MALLRLVLCVAFIGVSANSAISRSTFLGGDGLDGITALAVDRSGYVYVAGWTDSSNLPTTGPAGSGRGGGTDAFVAKWNPGGTALVYCRYLGGSGYERANGLALDDAGNVYVTGSTTSADFPVVNAIRPTLAGEQDAFVTKLDASGRIVYSTFLGGSGTDAGNSITVDSTGRAYIAGETASSNFPVLNAFQSSFRGQTDAFVTAVNPPGSQWIYSTYLGGSGDDHARAIAVDSSGNAYLTGDTTLTDFPVVNAFQRSSGGNQDAFAAKLSPDGRYLLYSSYLGGGGGAAGAAESGTGIAVDAAGNAYVTGATSSSDFPAVSGLQVAYKGNIDGFLTKINPSGAALVYSTYLGGVGIDITTAVAVDPEGNAFVVGYTASPDFPLMLASQASLAGLYDAFLTKISWTGTRLLYSTFLGGDKSDAANAIALDPAGMPFIAGQTLSANFPLRNPLQGILAANLDAFLARIEPAQRYNGAVDSASCTAVTGWAWDASSPNTPVNVDILDGTTTLATIPAGGFRQDLLNSGFGNGFHGFSYPVPAGLLDGLAHSIRVRISGVEINLAPSATLSCPTLPTVSSINPVVSTGGAQTYTFQFSDPDGYQDLSVLNVLINRFVDGRQACYIAYVRSTNTVYLVNDAGDAGGPFAGALVLNGSGSISNSYCTIRGAGSSASGSGNVLTLTLNYSFSPAFGGNRVVYTAARDAAGHNSGWRTSGVRAVARPPVFPDPVGMSPSSGSTPNATISFTFQDAANANNLQTTWILINSALDGRVACYVAYYKPGNQLYLYPDNGDGSQATNITLTGTNTISNSQCAVSAQGSSVSAKGPLLTVSLNMTFSPSFEGEKAAWLAVQTLTTQISQWQPVGAWRVM